MELKGNKRVEEFWKLLRDESPRCVVIVSAAFFDEMLAGMLGDKAERSLHERLREAHQRALLTSNEFQDLDALRTLRNAFAHDLRANSFDAGTTLIVESLRTWQLAFATFSSYGKSFPTPLDRLLYVVGVIAFRLQHRTLSAQTGPLPEPVLTDIGAWPPVVSFLDTAESLNLNGPQDWSTQPRHLVGDRTE